MPSSQHTSIVSALALLTTLKNTGNLYSARILSLTPPDGIAITNFEILPVITNSSRVVDFISATHENALNNITITRDGNIIKNMSKIGNYVSILIEISSTIVNKTIPPVNSVDELINYAGVDGIVVDVIHGENVVKYRYSESEAKWVPLTNAFKINKLPNGDPDLISFTITPGNYSTLKLPNGPEYLFQWLGVGPFTFNTGDISITSDVGGIPATAGLREIISITDEYISVFGIGPGTLTIVGGSGI